MGFMDEIGGGGTKLLKFDGKAGQYVARGSDASFNNHEFDANHYAAKAGYIGFGEKGEKPERRMGSVFPKDEAPDRASLGDTDKTKWPAGRFGDGPQDPWTPVIEIPLQHRATGEDFLFTASSKTALAAAKDFLAQCRKVPEGFLPTVRLGVGSFKSRFGDVKKPVLHIVGKAPIEGGDDPNPFNDELLF